MGKAVIMALLGALVTLAYCLAVVLTAGAVVSTGLAIRAKIKKRRRK